MGRPPIGKRAMTAAERQRRHRATANKSPVTKPVTKPSDGSNAKELAAAKARIRELENAGAVAAAEIAAERKRQARKSVTKPADPDTEIARAKATIANLRRALRHFQKRPEGKIDARTFTIIRSRMHPDRVSDPEKKARYKAAFEVFGELEKAVVDKDQLPLTREEWDAMRKKPEAKKRQSPKPARAIAK
jgi:hypothetical protein